MGIHYQRGQALFTMKRYREAADAYRQELAENPQQPLVYALLGAALVNSRQIRQAEQAVARAIELDPQLAYAYYILSYIELRKLNYAGAERAIVESIRLLQSPDAFHQWAVIAEDRGKYAEAIAATGEALKLDPWHIPALLMRGKLMAKSGNWNDARKLFAAAISQNPGNAEAQHALGKLWLRSGDSETAIDMLREARRLDPIRENDPNSIAMAYGRMLWPLRTINPMLFRWRRLSHRLRWFCILPIALSFAALYIAKSWNSSTDIVDYLAMAAFVAASNVAVLPLSFDLVSWAVGRIVLLRELRTPSTDVLFILYYLPVFVLTIHGVASIAGAVSVVLPLLGLIVCEIGLCFPLISESSRSGTDVHTAYVLIPLLVIGVFLGTFSIFVLSTAPIIGSTIFVSFLLFSYSSDKIAWNIASWHVDAHPLLKNKPD